MNRKFKLFFSLASLCLSVAMLCFGVYSAMSVNYSVSGSVSYEVRDVFVNIELSVYRSMSDTPIKSHTENENKLLSAQSETVEGFELLQDYNNTVSTYDPQTGKVESPGKDWTEPSYDGLNFTYGAPGAEDSNAYTFYIVLDITNYGSELINATVINNTTTAEQNTIFDQTDNINIPAKAEGVNGSGRIVLGLALDDVTRSANGDFNYEITVSMGELPNEVINDMLFTIDEANKTATFAGYTGTAKEVQIPSSFSLSTTDTNIFTGTLDDVMVIFNSLDSSFISMPGSLSYTTTSEGLIDLEDSVSPFLSFFYNLYLYANIPSDLETITFETLSQFDIGLNYLKIMNRVIYNLSGITNLPACTIYPLAMLSKGEMLSFDVKINMENVNVEETTVLEDIINIMHDNLPENMNEYSEFISFVDSNPTMSFDYTDLQNNRSDEYYALMIASNYLTKYIQDNDKSPEPPSDFSMPEQETGIYLSFSNMVYSDKPVKGKEYTVTSIGGDAFKGNTSVEKCEIPYTVTSIKSRAFSDCTNLKYIILPNEIKDIEYNVFYNTPWLTTLKSQSHGIAPSYNGDAYYAIEVDTEITDEQFETYKSNLKAIATEAFNGCKNLTSIDVPDGMTIIGNNTFNGCTNLENVILPNTITEIGSSAFTNTKWLTKLQSDSYGIATSKDGSATYAIDVNTSITDGELSPYLSKLKAIAAYAFQDCINITTFNMPYGATKIGSYSFSGCTALESVVISDSVIEIESESFAGCTNLRNFTLGIGVVEIGNSSFSDSTFSSFVFKDKMHIWSLGGMGDPGDVTFTELQDDKRMARLMSGVSGYSYYLDKICF